MEHLPRISDFRLVVLPGRCPPKFESIAFHNEVYDFWKSFWSEVFRENKSTSAPDANVFYRQDFVGVVMKEERIVGTVFFTENNLASNVTADIGYFSRPYVIEFSQKMKNSGIYGLSTLEMLTVAPEFRKRLTGVSFGSVLIGIVMEAFRASEAEIVFGPVRTDNGADHLLFEFGWKLVSAPYSMHGTPVALSALFRKDLRRAENLFHRRLIDHLWRTRVDLRPKNIAEAAAA